MNFAAPIGSETLLGFSLIFDETMDEADKTVLKATAINPVSPRILEALIRGVEGVRFEKPTSDKYQSYQENYHYKGKKSIPTTITN